ncbi:nucleotide exchange factors-like protein [Phanerochaete sordida]|uniref:Nucleotide exchange factors-like protein n=1 Tax=Phanerochaete sordida TaxID=48140 RepID=A0A9P3LBX5_9APHY|nr:nucleotide exchange factors-like protein [Phanerochaete sordida]
MQSLLRWSIENSAGDGSAQPPQPPQPRKDLDPGIIDMILGKPDSELMKENLAIAVDEKRSEDERLEALDNFEMLVESIDNANDLVKLNMWEPLHNLITSPSSSNDIKTQTLWIVGTAVQNNPAAQNAYLALSPMHTLLSFLNPSNGAPKLRSKAVYALSGLTKHSAPALRQFADADGWDALRGALQDSDVSVRRKVAFLLNALLIPSVPEAPRANPPNPRAAGATLHGADADAPAHADPVHPNSHAAMADPGAFATSAATRAALEQRGLLGALVDALVRPVPHGPDGERLGDAEFEEKLVHVLFTYTTSLQGELAPEHKQALAAYLKEKSAAAGGDGPLAESWGLSADELRALRKIVE